MFTKARDSKEYKEVINEVMEFLKALKQEILSFEFQNGYDQQLEEILFKFFEESTVF